MLPTTEAVSAQAAKIINKFGGARKLAESLSAVLGYEVAPSIVYRWSYPKTKGGTGGYVPSSAIDNVKRAARREGVMLTDKDWAP